MPRAPYPGGTGYETELILIDTDSNEDPLDGRDAGEARVIAKRIGELVGTLPVTENGVTRPAAYGDFCILLRSKKGRSDIYAAELTKAGVPVTTAGDRGFFATPEISLALSLLRVIDNPLLDVPLLAVLLSPLYGFTPDDLARHPPPRPPQRALSRVEPDGRAGDHPAKMGIFRSGAGILSVR